jgi:hypothetical protein
MSYNILTLSIYRISFLSLSLSLFVVFVVQLIDLSNDSYSTVNIGMDEGASPHSVRGSFLHGSSGTPPYLSSHSNPMGQGNHFPYSDNIVYTPLGMLF